MLHPHVVSRPTPAATHTEPPTLEFVTPTAVRCHCQEYAVNGFCAHLVHYMAAKIGSHLESFKPQSGETNA